MDDVLKKGRPFYDWRNGPFMPVEFSVAAYRLGRSQVRPSYRAHFTGKGGLEPFFGFIFGEGGSAEDPDDLRGGARAMKADPLSGGELDDLKAHGLGLENSTPLWFYLLREAERHANGERLGPVGGRIVAEVFYGLLEGDRASYLSQAPDWRPTLPTLEGGRAGKDFRMADLLRFAGVA